MSDGAALSDFFFLVNGIAALLAFFLLLATPVMLSFTIRRNPAVAAVPRRQAMVTWAGVLFSIGVLLVAIGWGTYREEVWAVVGLFSSALGITLLAVELIVTALAPTTDDEGAPPPR